MKRALLSVEIRTERDVVSARRRARQVGALLGFDVQDQTRIATAVSEVARNAFRYAGGGIVDFAVETERDGPDQRQCLMICVRDKGPGIADVAAVLESRSASATDLGIIGAKRLMDRFHIVSSPGGGTSVALGKMLPRRAPPITAERLNMIVQELARHPADDPYIEVQEQNRDLLRSLEELRLRQEELARLNAELADTNRGVLALYAELDERAEHLRSADEMKTRFLSNVSHEFRTPVNSILALSRLLLERVDGELTAEQEKQVSFIRQAAEDLGELVDDLLDLAKVQAGKSEVRPEAFTVADLFGALRGMLRPLLVNNELSLLFDDPAGLPPLWTDQGKVAQILRNFLSNALKFTERGTVRVSAAPAEGGTMVVFSVTDTGIGIAPEDQERIFDEFSQIDNRLQRQVKGTGLGLPLSKRLAALLGGSVTLQSAPGRGSTFSLVIPRSYGSPETAPEPTAGWQAALAGRETSGTIGCALIVDNDEIARYTLRHLLPSNDFQVIEAASGADGLRLARELRPDLVFLDLAMPGMQGDEVLERLKADEATEGIPVIIFTSASLGSAERERLSSASAFLIKADLSRDTVAEAIRQASGATGAHDAQRA